jgi:hypothetical protein
MTYFRLIGRTYESKYSCGVRVRVRVGEGEGEGVIEGGEGEG